jgi:hypothetical protein
MGSVVSVIEDPINSKWLEYNNEEGISAFRNSWL